MRPDQKPQRGFTLVEMIVVIVITGIIAGMVAMFIRAPVQGYMDSARRAEMTDIADTALRRMRRDIRTAVPNSVRLPAPAGSTYIEFLPTKAGGRYRANADATDDVCPGVAGDDDVLSFAAADTCFEIIGSAITFAAGDQIVVGSTQSDGNLPYDTSAAGVLRAHSDASLGAQTSVVLAAGASQWPAFAELPGQRFDVVSGEQQVVTYACENVGVAGGEGAGTLRRYWKYGFQATQKTPAQLSALAHSEAVLADRISACNIVYDVVNQRNGLVAITLGITRGGESISLYQEIHVNNIP